MADATIKNIPRNPALGVIADWLMSAKKTGGTIGDFFLGKSPEVLDSLSYGFKPTTGQGMTFGVKPEAVDLMNLTPIGSLAGMAGKPVAKMAGREIASQVETGTGILGRNVIDPRMYAVKNDGASSLGELNTLNPTGGLYVDYTPEIRATQPLGVNMVSIDKTMGGNPDDIITIYRGAPKKQKSIVAGDFVTDMKELAQSYTGDGNVLELKVRKGDVLDMINEPLGNEYIYRPNADKYKRTK